MSKKSKKSLLAFLFKRPLKKDTSQSNKHPRATLNFCKQHVFASFSSNALQWKYRLVSVTEPMKLLSKQIPYEDRVRLLCL